MPAQQFPFQERSRLVDDIQEYIRDQIYTGRYPPGTRLRQEQLAEELDVSRTPLREALRVLQNEGLLALTRGNRVEVVSVEEKRFLDALVLRELVDGAAARIVAERRPGPRLRSDISRSLASQRAALDPWDRITFSRTDADLHAAILRGSDNEYLEGQIVLVRLIVQVFQMDNHFGPERALPKVAQHEQIVEAIFDGDPGEAERRARDHIAGISVEVRAGALSARTPAAQPGDK